MSSSIKAQAEDLAKAISTATAASPNEENLRHEVEKALERACNVLGLTWTAYRLERTLKRTETGDTRFADAAHGAIVIEYEPPGIFSSGRSSKAIKHAQEQAEEYAALLSDEEGRPLDKYVLIVWDGRHIGFGRYDANLPKWERVDAFGAAAAERLLQNIADDGAPLVNPTLLSQIVGPDSEIGQRLMPKLFSAVRDATQETSRTSKTLLLFTEWRRLFGQVVGVQSDKLKALLADQARSHGAPYDKDPPAYLFALNTYIALVAKLVAAMALPNTSQNIADPAPPVAGRVDVLESGQLFSDAGVENMLNGDFFAWYRDDRNWEQYAHDIEGLIEALRGINFDVSRKSAESTRDLFKGLYMNFIPQAVRHALGEYYTPDWLAAHALDQIEWKPQQGLGDPTAGSGTFILEALKRRIAAMPRASAHELLKNLWGLDLNPLAVLAARTSLVVYLAGKLEPTKPLRLPIYLADAINPATDQQGTYTHRLQTERGERTFRVPADLVKSENFYAVLNRTRELIDANIESQRITQTLEQDFDLSYLSPNSWEDLADTVGTLAQLHSAGWNGIWCAILAERFAAGAIPPGQVIAGNPPWVKWSHLPPQYAEFIKDRCIELGVFSVDRWVGGIESDISTVITYEVVDKYLQTGGTLAFFITGTVFANESSQGFRRWRLSGSSTDLEVQFVEDYAAVGPFEGVSNHATLLVLKRGGQTVYPVNYRVWTPPRETGGRVAKRNFKDASAFRAESSLVVLSACPVPGTDAGPWLKGTDAQQSVWEHLFGAQEPSYRARKGVTTDANGIYFVKTADVLKENLITVENDPSNGRRALPTVRRNVEPDHVFPLLRGKGVSAFQAIPDSAYQIVVPQRGMHGDPDLPTTAPKTHQWLNSFKEVLGGRSSYKRFQKRQGAPFWSIWSTGEYTFAPFKVAWREMSGGRFAAGYVGMIDDPRFGSKPVIPDHKLYFVSCETEDEAAYLTGFLNAPVVAEAVSAYAAQLSLGASVVEYLLIQAYDQENEHQRELAELAKSITSSGGSPSSQQEKDLDLLVAHIQSIPGHVLTDARADVENPTIRGAEHTASM